jgi:hypothetical protein
MFEDPIWQPQDLVRVYRKYIDRPWIFFSCCQRVPIWRAHQQASWLATGIDLVERQLDVPLPARRVNYVPEAPLPTTRSRVTANMDLNWDFVVLSVHLNLTADVVLPLRSRGLGQFIGVSVSERTMSRDHR